MTGKPLYPDIEVKLSDQDGNAFAIIGRITKEMKAGKVYIHPEEIKQFQAECMSGDYDNLLQTCMKWVTVL